MFKKKPLLTECINYEKEIKDYRFVQIFSGVGSGKNYFVERFIEGDEKHSIPKKTILIITSRRAKADEIFLDEAVDIENKIIQKWDEYHHVYDDFEDIPDDVPVRILIDDWGEHRVYQKSAVCTNAFVEQYSKYVYSGGDITTHLWELFDIIIIDEVHSVVLDATYQSAPFYIRDLVSEFIKRHELADKEPEKYKRPLCEQIIIMAGTEDAVKAIETPENSTTINRMEVCRRAYPRNIRFITMDAVKRQIADQLAAGERIVYFQNHTTLPKEFIEGTSIDPEVIVPSFTKEEKRRNLEKNEETLYRKIIETEKSIKEENLVPQYVRLFLSTSRNKEGININDKDIKYIYVESHIISEIEQMAGRVRAGVEDLYIIVDADEFSTYESKYEELFSRDEVAGKNWYDACGAANDYFRKLCKTENVKDLFHNREFLGRAYDNKNIREFIRFIHSKFPYVRYSCFDNMFKFYSFRKRGRKYIKDSIDCFNRVILDKELCVQEFKKWFPYSEIHPYYTVDMKAVDIFNKYIPVIEGVAYDESVIEDLTAELKRECYPELNRLQYMLNRFCDLKSERANRHPSHEDYKKRKFVRRMSGTA